MKKTDWIDVIGKIDPAYVKEAEQWSKAAQKKRNLRHFTAMAACVCILLAGAVVSFDLWVQNKDTGAETESAVAEGMNEGASAQMRGTKLQWQRRKRNRQRVWSQNLLQIQTSRSRSTRSVN